MKTVQVIGGNGFTGGELIRLLLHHPEVNVLPPYSRSAKDQKIFSVHKDLYGITELSFTDQLLDADIYFLCLPHGESRIFCLNANIPDDKLLIDLGSDFRYRQGHSNRKFIYGLPEMNKERIASSMSIANPGCFATAIQLSLLPLAEKQIIKGDIHVSATTGSTGAGASLTHGTHFTWRQNNHSPYKIFSHQHLGEINDTMKAIQKGFSSPINFIPQRGSFTRGIISCTWLSCDSDPEEILELYTGYYRSHTFTHVVPFDIDVKMVVNTNNCFIQVYKKENKLAVISVIDNLLKGAAGQAVQNMNIALGCTENTGLKLKPSVF